MRQAIRFRGVTREHPESGALDTIQHETADLPGEGDPPCLFLLLSVPSLGSQLLRERCLLDQDGSRRGDGLIRPRHPLVAWIPGLGQRVHGIR